MTHGDKTKAKAAKSNKASGKKAGAQGGENGKIVKAGAQSSSQKAGSQAGKVDKGSSQKAAAGKKGSGSAPAKESAADSQTKTDSKTKSSGTPPRSPAGKANSGGEAGTGFNNPIIHAAFKQALKKYPNALRKLTD
ncbi:MAG TPA: hypothetical protein VEK79_09225 [Thermoanaerobaculia bacterium]|nr:hypothetical protein [Thermoanaerobaculia bacterium]